MHIMKEMHMMTTKHDRRHGRRRLTPGSLTIGSSFYPSAELRERIEREVLLRSVRDGSMSWSFSGVVVDVLEEHFGLKNGHNPTD